MSHRLPTWMRCLCVLFLLSQLVLPAQASPQMHATAAIENKAEAKVEAETLAAPAPATLPVVEAETSSFILPSSSFRLDLRLTAEPTWAEPGEVVTFTVAAANPAAEPVAGLVLSDALPDGLIYVQKSAQGFEYSAQDQQLTWAAGTLAAGAVITGSFQARVQGLALGATLTNTVMATSPALTAPVTGTTTVDVVSPRNHVAWATPEAGGLLRSTDDRVLLRVPPGAAPGRVRFTYQPQADVPNPPAGLRFAFSVDAQDEGGQPVHQFAAPLALAWAYRPAEAPTAGERLTLYYFDAATQAWASLPTRLAREGRQVRADVPHLTLFAAATGDAIVTEWMSQVRGAMTSLFNRTIAYGYAFDVPPGRGGLAPALGLSYSSANHTQHQGHYSYAGHGWDIAGASYVYREPRIDNPSAGAVTLTLNGRTYTLKATPGGNWYAVEDPLLRIRTKENINNYGGLKLVKWEVTTGDGTVYSFGGDYDNDADISPKVYYWHCEGLDGQEDWYPYAWSRVPLTHVKDRNGNVVRYVWAAEKGEIGAIGDDATVTPRCEPFADPGYVRAIRLSAVYYNQERTAVVFNYTNDRVDRPDSYQVTDTAWAFFTIYRLRSVDIKVLLANQSTWTTLRSYVLSHAPPGTDAISQRVLNLETMEERAGGQAVTTGFTYNSAFLTYPGSYGWLTKITNAYGGAVEFGLGGGAVGAPLAVAQRIERDQITGQTATWGFNSSGWNDQAHGYAKVWATAPNGLCTIHDYQQMITLNGQERNTLVGRESKTTTCSACTADGGCSGELTRRETDWAHSTADLPVAGYGSMPIEDQPRFVSASETRAYETGASGPLALLRTTYEHEPARQAGSSGAKQYGNLTRVKEYQGAGGSFATAPTRATLTWYYPNEGPWLINQSAATKTYAGDEATLVAESRNYYKGNLSYTTPPPSPLLIKAETVGVVNGVYSGGTIATTYDYEGNGNLSWAKDPKGNQSTYVYDTWFQAYRVCETNALGHNSKRAYYGVPGGASCNTVGGTQTFTGNRFGQLEKATDANNVTTMYGYDDLGRATSVLIPPDTAATRLYEYRPLNEVTAGQPFWVREKQRDGSAGDGYLHKFTYYDGFGRVIQAKSEVDSSQHVETTTAYTWFDAVERTSVPVFVSGDAAGTTPLGYRSPGTWSGLAHTRSDYDARGRVVKVTQPDGTFSETKYFGEYNAADPDFTITRLTVHQIDANRHFVRRVMDAFGNLRVVSESYGVWPQFVNEQRTRYAYDVLGRLTQVKDHAGNETTLTYDAFGRKTAMTDPDMGAWSYRYDAAGNLVKQRDARNQAICFYYDNLNRLLGKTYHADTPNLDTLTCTGSYVVSYGYDAYDGSTQFGLGRRTTMTDTSGSTTWVYDVRGRVKQTTQTITERGTFVTQWGYDAADRPVWQKYPADNTGQLGEQVNYGYNAAGGLTSVAGQATYVQSTTYDAAGRVDVRTLGSGLATDYDYYPWAQAGGRLARLQTGALQDLRYSYDAVGNVTRIEDYRAGAPEVQSFNYDSLDRLIGVSGAYTETYTFAANGNLMSKAGVDYSYSAPVSGCAAGTPGSKPHAATQAGNRAYRYDCNGNMTDRAGQVLRYDQENRLTQVVGEAVTTYRYNGDGGRVTLTTGCTTTTYVGNTFEWRGSTATMTSYYYAGGTRVAMRTGTPLTGTVSYLLGDHLGSSSVSYRADGAQTATQRYYPWGTIRPGPDNVLPTDYGFTGQKLDASARLLYYGARYYDSALGRFIQADTIVPQPGNPQSLNRYSYVLNRPTVYRDPTGHAPEWLNYVSGAVSQYMNDMTFGLWSALAVPGGNMDFIPSDAYQQGRELGRSASTAQAQFEVATGIGIAAAGVAAGPPTLAVTAVCAVGTAGICALPGGVVLTVEGAMVLGGGVGALHGGGVLLYAKGHPVDEQADLQKHGRPSKNYAQKTQENAAIRSYERQTGKTLSKDQRQVLHEALHEGENPGYDDIVNMIYDLFGGQ